MNKDKNGLFDESCGGATGVPGSFDESLCLAPEEACKSQRTLVSFFVRAHNNVNQHTHHCRPRFTIKQGYDTYQEEYICAHSVVWGTKQLCGGGYSPAVDSRKERSPDRRERGGPTARTTTGSTRTRAASRKPLLPVAPSSARRNSLQPLKLPLNGPFLLLSLPTVY